MKPRNHNNDVVAQYVGKPLRVPDESLDSLAIKELKKGNPEAIEYIFNRYYNRLCLVAYEIVSDKDAAEDIVQELLSNLWLPRNDSNISYSLRAYLTRSVRNRSLSYLRDYGNRRVPLKEEYIEESYEIEEELYSVEIHALIQNFIDTLPVKCGQVFKLSKIERLTYVEIAESLKISVKTVENHLYKAKVLAKERLLPTIKNSHIQGAYQFSL